MLRVVRPLVIFSVVSSVCLGTFLVSRGAEGSESTSRRSVFRAFSGDYALSELELLQTSLFHVEESYVEPARIDYEKMFVRALESVEQRVPVTMFDRGGSRLHLKVGTTSTTLEVSKIQTSKDLRRELRRIAQLLDALSPDDIPMFDGDQGDPKAHVEYAMINGVLSTLDPHSVLLPPQDSKEMDVDNQGVFGGLGITIVYREGKLTVEYPIPGTPAEKADVRAGDSILRIDGESTINMSLNEAVGKLRGPIGSSVQVEILREGLAEPLPVAITRAEIKIHPVEGVLLDGRIGYADIPSFHAQVDQDLTELLSRLERDANGHMKGLVLDLRFNPGGFLNQAEAVADYFLEKGTIVAQVDANGNKLESFEAKRRGTEPRYPIVILVNSSSASASEIVAGALRNNDRAIIIGERTYGKGSVQNLHSNSDGSKLKLTISKYLTPGDQSIQAVGIPADIEVIPTVVEKKKDAVSGLEDFLASLYEHERVHREADSDLHLEQSAIKLDEPPYSFRYQRPIERKRRTSAALDLSGDFEVQFARDVLLAAKGTRRSDLIASAAPVVEKYRKEGDKQIVTAFQKLSVDWTDGPSVGAAELSVRFDLGADGVLSAGEAESVGLEVKNNGSKTIYRLSAVATFDGDYTPREFVFGKLSPGETRRYEQKVQLLLGHPTELSPVTFSFRDRSGEEVAIQHARLPVQGNALPQLDWQLSLTDASPGGDADGMMEIGEKISVKAEIKNTGSGPTSKAFARIKNKAGRALDITQGSLEPGVLRDATGKACETRSSVCKPVIAAGESWVGTFEVLVKAPLRSDEPFRIAFELGDDQAYDHASIGREGFGGYFTNKQDISFELGKEAPSVRPGVAPRIRITRAPGVVESAHSVVLSGLVTDDSGVSHVEVYNGKNKVFFQGSGPGTRVKSVPFTADIELKPGLNTVAVLATDDDGFTDTGSVVTFFLAPELQAQVGDVVSKAGMPELKRREN